MNAAVIEKKLLSLDQATRRKANATELIIISALPKKVCFAGIQPILALRTTPRPVLPLAQTHGILCVLSQTVSVSLCRPGLQFGVSLFLSTVLNHYKVVLHSRKFTFLLVLKGIYSNL